MAAKDTQTRSLPLSADSAPTAPGKKTPPSGSGDKGRALRQRLEQILTRTQAALPAQEAAPTLLEEVRQALDELEAHQSELEIQNQELRVRLVELDASRALTESKRAVEALRASEEKFRSLSESSHDHIVLYDQQYRPLYMNPAALDFAGPGQDALLGSSRQSAYFENLRPMLHEQIRQVFTTAAPLRTELEWNSPEGLKYFDWRLTPVSDAEGRVCSVLGVSRDITEQKQVEALKLEMERKFQQYQKLESLGVLAGGLAHDFNNILSIILGQCDLLSEDLDAGSDRISQVQHIEDAALRAADLCRQMLTYVGKKAPVQSRIDLRLIVEETVKLLQPTQQTTVCLELDSNQDVFEINGDRAQIQQVIMDLYFNAVEAIGEREGTITIALNKSIVNGDQTDQEYLGNPIKACDYACLTVSDNGCGMDAATRRRIFEPFYTTKHTGRGLGLSAALGVVTSHDGALQLSTTPGLGTTFKLFLPLCTVPGLVSAAQPADISPQKAHGTLLLVDDEAPLRIIGSALLKAMGFTVLTAAGGREALDIHRASPKIDLILLDQMMPEMDGIETYRLLRQLSPTLPIALCTEGNAEDLADDLTDDPFAETVQKPYKPDQLRHIFIKLMGLR